MKIKSTITLFVMLFAAFLFMNNSSGAADVQGADRTGSPLSNGSCNTVGCHASGAFNPSVTVEVLTGSTVVTEYEPGATYTVRVTIAAGTGTPAEYGFQTVALNSADENAGEWSVIPNGGQQHVTFANDVTYVEHSMPSTSNTFTTASWDAPLTGGGDVTFYAGAIATNDNGGTSGDGGATASVTLSEAGMSATNDLERSLGFSVFPNPAQEALNLQINSLISGPVDLRITDVSGKTIHRERFDLFEGEFTKRVDISDLNNGLYLLFLSNESGVATETIVKI